MNDRKGFEESARRYHIGSVLHHPKVTRTSRGSSLESDDEDADDQAKHTARIAAESGQDRECCGRFAPIISTGRCSHEPNSSQEGGDAGAVDDEAPQEQI